MAIDDTTPTSEQRGSTVLRRVPWIVLCCLLAAGAAYAVSSRQTKKYTATAVLVLVESEQAAQVAGLPVTSSNDQQAQQNADVSLVAG